MKATTRWRTRPTSLLSRMAAATAAAERARGRGHPRAPAPRRGGSPRSSRPDPWSAPARTRTYVAPNAGRGQLFRGGAGRSSSDSRNLGQGRPEAGISPRWLDGIHGRLRSQAPRCGSAPAVVASDRSPDDSRGGATAAAATSPSASSGSSASSSSSASGTGAGSTGGGGALKIVSRPRPKAAQRGEDTAWRLRPIHRRLRWRRLDISGVIAGRRPGLVLLRGRRRHRLRRRPHPPWCRASRD